MSCPSFVVAKPLLEEADSRSARCNGKAVVILALLAGFGFGALVSRISMLVTSTDSWSSQDPAISMAWQSMQTSPVQSMPAKAGAFMQPRMSDVRDLLRSSPTQKCVYVNQYASLCGKAVVLRPSTAVGAEAGGSGKQGVSVNVDEVLQGVTEKLNAIEDKPQAAIYAGGALVAVVITNSIVTSIEALPLIPKLLELVGTGYSAWFTYRYLLKKESRNELKADIEAIKEKVLG